MALWVQEADNSPGLAKNCRQSAYGRVREGCALLFDNRQQFEDARGPDLLTEHLPDLRYGARSLVPL